MSGPLSARVQERLAQLGRDRVVERIWARDPSVWSDDPATPELADRLGWLEVGDTMAAAVVDLAAFAEEIHSEFDRVIVCGMGGSSLAPEVLWRVGGPRSGFPVLHLLDSTHPDAVRAASAGMERSLLLVVSKSGTTIETASFDRYFWDRSGQHGAQFLAITDPDTVLDRSATERGFRRVFQNPPDIGGRFSALSLFGLVPAAVVGADVDDLLARAQTAARALRRPAPENRAAQLGALLGEAALAGRDKLTLVLDAGLASFGLWVEQLVAESTGKRGRGLLPVVGEDPDTLTGAAPDRCYVVRTLGAPSGPVAALLDRLATTGAPTDVGALDGPSGIAAEFLTFELATAIAGAILEVNPFDQPNVAESKANTARVLETAAPAAPAADAATVRRWLSGVRPGDYVAVMAFLDPSAETDRRLAGLRAALARRLGVAITVGYGPRFLHSTGQLHKGGPPRGHFVQLLDPDMAELAIPDAPYGFARLLQAQADGDLEALRARGRPAVRVTDWDLFEREVRG